jgi:cobalt-zinc-cadmium efflux system protein
VHVAARRVAGALVVTVLAALVELFVSHRAGSLFLVADAAHLLAHLGIFLVLLVPARGAHEAREDVATCTVLALVVAIAIGIGVESVRHLVKSEASPPAAAMLYSLVGLVANLVSAWLLRDPARERWSFRAALAHELADGALTIVALFGAGAIALFHFRFIDPGLSLAVALWLLGWALRLVVRRVRQGRSAWRMESETHDH